jgi:hypothetical protein
LDIYAGSIWLSEYTCRNWLVEAIGRTQPLPFFIIFCKRRRSRRRACIARMDSGLFDKFLKESKRRLNDKSDSEKVRVFIDWCLKNNYEEIILRISSEEKGGWASNYFLDFTTNRIIVTKKSFLTKFASPEELVKRQGFSIWYSDIAEFVLRRGIETLVTNMFGRAIVSNFLHIKTSSGKEYNFTLPVNKNGTYEQIRFWIGVVLPSFCPPY